MPALTAGAILRHDSQSDMFEGEYRLVEQVGRNQWVIEEVEPSDALIDEITAYFLDLEGPAPYTGYVDPWGPGRRVATRQEALDAEVCRRIDRAGHRSTVRFVSQAEWAAAF